MAALRLGCLETWLPYKSVIRRLIQPYSFGWFLKDRDYSALIYSTCSFFLTFTILDQMIAVFIISMLSLGMMSVAISRLAWRYLKHRDPKIFKACGIKKDVCELPSVLAYYKWSREELERSVFQKQKSSRRWDDVRSVLEMDRCLMFYQATRTRRNALISHHESNLPRNGYLSAYEKFRNFDEKSKCWPRSSRSGSRLRSCSGLKASSSFSVINTTRT